MNHRALPRLLIAAVALACCAPAGMSAEGAPGATFVAGDYPRQSPEAYGEPARSSQHVAVRDGTRLAINIYRPTDPQTGAVIETPLPVVWVFTGSPRARVNAEGVVTPGMSDGFELVRRGYVFAVAETRGRGASFGTRDEPAGLQEARDAWDLTEWLAAQPWSNGRIGMYGGASLGRTQLTAAFYRPPHLRALFLGFTEFDRYDGWSRGGIPDNPATSFRKHTSAADTTEDAAALQPVDGDDDRSLLRAAIGEHAGNTRFDTFFPQLPWRDSVSPVSGKAYWLETTPSRRARALGRPGLAIYHSGGWYADSRRDTLLMLRNLPNAQRAIIGPWNPASPKPEREAERTAFFDRYLKDIDNGIDRRPRIAYYTVNADEGAQWRMADRWPLPHERRTRWHLDAGGTLADAAPAAPGGDTRQARYDITSQSQFEIRGAMHLSAADRDAKASHWTSAPLAQDMEITGHPVAHLWISSDTPDVDVFVHLEHVDESGVSTYVTDGRLRASHRRLHRSPYDTAGLPWHRSNQRDMQPLKAGEPARLVLDLLPTSTIFRKGSRLRVTVSHADPAALFLRSDPAPTVTVHRGPDHPSYIDLPVIEASTSTRGESRQ